MMLERQGALNNQILRLGCFLPPPYQIPGYMPARHHDFVLMCLAFIYPALSTCLVVYV